MYGVGVGVGSELELEQKDLLWLEGLPPSLAESKIKKYVEVRGQEEPTGRSVKLV